MTKVKSKPPKRQRGAKGDRTLGDLDDWIRDEELLRGLKKTPGFKKSKLRPASKSEKPVCTTLTMKPTAKRQLRRVIMTVSKSIRHALQAGEQELSKQISR